MARVLIGWEFGAGLGHMTRLLPVARALAEAGHEPVFALQDLRVARDVLGEGANEGPGFVVLQGPYWHPPRGPQARKAPTRSFADILKLFRYDDVSLLSVMAEAWAGVIETVAPRLVVGDFAPTLMLAAAGRCPTVVLGNGYTVPPRGRRLPPIRPWESKLPEASERAEDDLTRAVNAVCEARHRPPVAFLSDLFSGTETFVCTIPEFDPYAAYRDRPQLAPFNLPTLAGRPPLADRPRGSVFVYLPADHPQLGAVLEAVASLDADCDAFVRGAPAGLKARFGSARLRFHERPLPLGEILPAVRAIVHHAGLSTAYTALLAGTPQLVLTRNLEHLVTAYGLKRFGSALALSANRRHGSDDIARLLNALLTDRTIAQAAEKAAAALEARPASDPVATVVDACLTHLG